MSFDCTKREAIKRYILEKIYQKDDFISKTVQAFGVSRTTAYKYVNSLANEGLIRLDSDGKYSIRNAEPKEYEYENKGLSEARIYKDVLFDAVADLPENAQDIWKYAFTEIANNAIEHSKAEHLRITVSKNALFTEVLVCDDGIGIFKGISDYYGMTDADDAVFALFKGKLTTDPQRHSGEGIFFVSKAMDYFRISSQGKSFFVSRHGDDPQCMEVSDEARGTIVAIILFNATVLDLKDVFDAYTTECSFEKTVVPVRFVSTSGQPISRSEARRLCFGLDKFKVAVLDFKGVRTIGQGFAHELFSVFAKKHEELKIECLNMSPDVERAIKHVL